jgi:NADPH:quinone reductase-like Zn-dependent oxidoreductase
MSTTKLEPLRGPPTPDTGAQTMRAVVQTRYSPAPEDLFRVAQIDRPTIGDGEVLVRVHAASVDRGTWHIMAGLPIPSGSPDSASAAPSTPTPAEASPERSTPSAPA